MVGKDDTTFRTLSLVVAAIIGVIGFVLFATKGRGGSGGSDNDVEIVVWGSVEKNLMANILTKANQSIEGAYMVYEPKEEETLEEEFIDALASGSGPDLIILTPDLTFKHSNKLFHLPYTQFPESAFQNSFVPAANVFLLREGIVALPLSIDPIVMFYNESLLRSQFQQNPPETWQELASLIPSVRFLGENNQIEQAGAGLGTVDNITHAKDILSSMFLQTQNPLVSYTLQEDPDDLERPTRLYQSTFNQTYSSQSTASVLTYYTSFASPNQQHYTWNLAQPKDVDMFLSGDLVFYLGKASELEELQARNPNLDIGIAVIPQADQRNKATYADILGVAIPNQSQKKGFAQTAATTLISRSVLEDIYKDFQTLPARQDLLRVVVDTDEKDIIRFQSGIISKSWQDPDPQVTQQLLFTAVRTLLSGNVQANTVLDEIDFTLDNLLQELL